MSRRPGAARAASLSVAAALVLAAVGPTSPAQAGLLDGLVGTAGGVVGTLTGTVGSLLGPTGWIVEDGETEMGHVASVIGADRLYARGYNGSGVGVALIDTGVAPVDGMTSGNVVNGPDLSFESQSPEHRYLDTFGHGTHMAGIIAGNDRSTLLGLGRFQGIAPGARLTSLKVGTTQGAVDVSQVVAAVDWVVTHRNDDPRNPIRVINLSYGTDGFQDYQVDPLTHAVENAWRAGIVVVVSGGNSGTENPHLNNPAYDPYVLAVGASDTQGTLRSYDDVVPEFSSRGDDSRRVDLVAPGKSIVSLRVPGAYIDEAYPSARVGDRYFKGSGSSQAAAVVSGAVALLLDSRPDLRPDQVKAMLRSTAEPMPRADEAGRGAGELDVYGAYLAAAPRGSQNWPRSTGLGSMEQARGSQHVADDGVELRGERHVLGNFNARKWAPASASYSAWNSGTWAGSDWTSGCWCEDTWAGKAWSGKAWSGDTWAGKAWSGKAWSGKAWSGKAWSGKAWSGKAWSGDSWTGKAWSGKAWSSAEWSEP